MGINLRTSVQRYSLLSHSFYKYFLKVSGSSYAIKQSSVRDVFCQILLFFYFFFPQNERMHRFRMVIIALLSQILSGMTWQYLMLKSLIFSWIQKNKIKQTELWKLHTVLFSQSSGHSRSSYQNFSVLVWKLSVGPVGHCCKLGHHKNWQ